MTKNAAIVICEEAILIFAIPPLSPQPPDLFDHNPTHIPPLFKIPFPDDIVFHPKSIEWKTISCWYFSSSRPIYFDMICRDYKLHRFKLIVEPDLSDASLHVINTSELTPHGFEFVYLQSYRICEDTLVSCWAQPHPHQSQCGVYTGSTSVPFGSVGPAAKMLLSEIGHGYRHIFSCPASGRFVALPDSGTSVFVLDFF